ncbi:alpha/beta hydrolase [Nonomuraea sp. NPDC050153]|uniref:alpha/beta hydrolase n=1 Tax=Nonomuraea sp. NPDC050153 TaxID=3364359 RepID=UPI0037B5DE17
MELIPLWEGASQEALLGHETFLPEITTTGKLRLIRNVRAPSLTVHTPDPSVATGTGVILCPGGSFATLPHWDDPEIDGIVRRLTEPGLTVFLLRYHLMPTPRDDGEFVRAIMSGTMDPIKAHARVAENDAFLAMRVVRERAASWAVDPWRVGIMGFSAGGLLTIVAATGYDADTRPDFAAPIYGTCFDPYTVPPDAPPLFVSFAGDDVGEGVVSSGLALYTAWHEAGRPAELHAYAEGGHRFASAPPGLPSSAWTDRFLDWLGHAGFLGRRGYRAASHP